VRRLLKATLKNDGTVEVEKKGWNVEKLKFIIVEFHGQVSSRYKYPINPKDQIKEIIIQTEEAP